MIYSSDSGEFHEFKIKIKFSSSPQARSKVTQVKFHRAREENA